MSQPESGRAGRPKTPKTKARLERLVTDWQKSSGQPVARLNLRIAAMMIAGALARVVGPDERAAFAIKGGIAMELRLGDRARATRDIDLVLRGDTDHLANLLDAGLSKPYNGFAFRRREIGDHPVRSDVKQVEVQVLFARKVLCTPKLEIAPAETGHEEFAALPGARLDEVGLDGPELVQVLATPWQIAQKLHAVTERYPAGRENPRVRDLVDIQFLEATDPDIRKVRDACEQVFASRGQHPWPPDLKIPPSWTAGYEAIAATLAFPVTDVNEAAEAVRGYIERIAGA